MLCLNSSSPPNQPPTLTDTSATIDTAIGTKPTVPLHLSQKLTANSTSAVTFEIR